MKRKAHNKLHKMTKEINAPWRDSYNLVLIGWSSYKYKIVLTRHTGDSAQLGGHGGTFNRGRLLHWGLDRREGSVIFFLAESRTRTPTAASIRCETGLLPSWGHRI